MIPFWGVIPTWIVHIHGVTWELYRHLQAKFFQDHNQQRLIEVKAF
jgi:hypothetical protein